MLRAVLLARAYPALIALIGLGLGALIRHTAGAICALVGVLFVLPLLFISPALQDASQNFLPHPMANAMTAVKPLAHTLPPGLIFSLLCAYALATLAAWRWACPPPPDRRGIAAWIRRSIDRHSRLASFPR